MAGRGPGLGGIVSRPTISSYDRSSLTPGMRNVFDGLAEAGFGDISVNSGFRSAAANAKARGAKSSQHLTGNAADFNFGGQPNERKAAFVDAARNLNVNGLGFYGQGDSIHLDTRQGAPVAWGVGGSFRRADPRAFPGFIQPNVTSFYNRQALAAPVTTPQTAIAGPVNAYAPEAASIKPSNPLSGRSRMPGAALRTVAADFAGMPSVPAAPQQPGVFGDGGWASRNQGGLLGGLLGMAALGPVGGLLGGIVGNAIQSGSKGTPSNAAKAAMNAGWDGFSGMTAGQTAAARGVASGGSSGSGRSSGSGSGGGGLLGSIGSAISSALGALSNQRTGANTGGGTFSSGASGPDGGKVGGSSSSGSKSSSSSGGKKK